MSSEDRLVLPARRVTPREVRRCDRDLWPVRPPLLRPGGRCRLADLARLTTDIGTDGAVLAVLATRRTPGRRTARPDVVTAALLTAGTFPATSLSLGHVAPALTPLLAGLPPCTLEVVRAWAPTFPGTLQELVDLAAVAAG